MANTLNLNALPEYVEQNKEQLFVESVVGAKSLDYVELMLGVKHKEALNYLTSEVVLKAASCSWQPDGSDTFAQRFIEVHLIEVEKEFCYLDFKEKYMNYQLRWEAGRETLPFEQKIAESNVEAIKAEVEKMVWQGNSGASVTGWLADAEEASATTISFGSGATAVSKIDEMVAAFTPKMLAKGVNLFVSYSDFGAYVREMNGSCCANKAIIGAASDELTYLGDSRVKIVPVLGLEDTGAMVASTKDGLVYGTDIADSETTYEIWFDRTNQKFMFRVLFAAGTAIKFPNEVIVGK